MINKELLKVYNNGRGGVIISIWRREPTSHIINQVKEKMHGALTALSCSLCTTIVYMDMKWIETTRCMFLGKLSSHWQAETFIYLVLIQKAGIHQRGHGGPT